MRHFQEIYGYDIINVLDELMQDYSPEKGYEDREFYTTAANWLEKNTPQKKRYLGFIQLLLNNPKKATELLDTAIAEDIKDPYAYYFRGIAFLKMASSPEKNASFLDMAQSDFSNSLKNNFAFRICPKCGHKESPNLNFCMFCGVKLLTA